MPEREQPIDPAKQKAQQTRRDLATGLQVLADMPGLIANFSWAAGQVMGSPDGDARIRGMIEFARAYQQFGLDIALGAIEATSGVPVEIEIPKKARGEHVKQGRIVAVVEKHDRTSFRGVFYGIAVMPNRNDVEDFHAVTVSTNGTDIITRLLPEHLEPAYQELPGRVATEEILALRLAQNHMPDGGPRRAR